MDISIGIRIEDTRTRNTNFFKLWRGSNQYVFIGDYALRALISS